jgi:hypothetical protein
LIFPFGYLVSTEREVIFNPISLSRAALIALAGELASFLYLFIAQMLFLGSRKEVLQPIWKCVFVWFSTGLVRGFFVGAYAHWAFGYEWRLLQRVPSAAAYTTVVMALAAIYFGTIERRRTEFEAMRTLDSMLAEDERELLTQEVENRRVALEVLNGELLPQVESLRDGISDALEANAGTDGEEVLEDLYERSLRISQEIEKQRNVLESGGNIRSQEQKAEPGVSYWNALVPSILSVRITAIFFVLGTISGQLPRNGLEGVTAGLLGLIPLIIVIAPFSIAIKRVKKFKGLIFLAGFVSVYLISYLYNSLQPTFGFHLKHAYEPWYSASKTIYGLYFASVVASLLVDFSEKRKFASEVGESRINVVDQLTSQNLEMEKSLFAARFGVLQGKISGVTMALHLLRSQTMGAISEDRKMTLLHSANQLLTDSLIEIDSLKIGVR